MPIYEYKCPEGHVFELFQRFADPPAETCQVCGASPVVKVLYPAAVHFKGSGFYTTDYQNAGKKRGSGSGDGSSSSSSSSEGGGSSSKDGGSSSSSGDSGSKTEKPASSSSAE